MELVLDSDQEALRSTVRDLLAARADSAAVRAAFASEVGHDADLWRRLGVELGVLGLAVPEDFGGAGAGHVERAVLAEELGRALVPSPFLGSTVLAVDVLSALGDASASADLLPGLASGERLGAVAVAEPGQSARGALHAGVRPQPPEVEPVETTTGARPQPPEVEPVETTTGARPQPPKVELVETTATPRDGGWTLTGSKTAVIDGAAADVLLVLAGTDDGPAFFRVDTGASGLTRTPLTTLDLTRRICRVDLSGTPATRLEGDALAALAHATDLALVALGAEQVGGMERALSMTVDYAKVRVQFGRAIGSYQAVKHGLADAYVAHELADSALRHAAWTADHDPDGLPVAAALLSSYAGPAFFATARDAVQFHGGIGYTWEHDAGLYYRRAKSDELLLGSAAVQRARLADLIEV